MSKTREQGKVPPPPLDEDGNPVMVEDGSNTETSTAPTVEELMKQLEKLNAEVKRLKAKGKKGKNHSSSSEDDDSSFEEKVSNKGKKEKKRRDKSSYNAMSFNYDNMSSSTTYTSVPVDKAPYFDESNCNQWKHCMKNYLYFISPEVWKLFVMV
jgi:predicted RNase H-like nuclease (RuvC/YqgF family)